MIRERETVRQRNAKPNLLGIGQEIAGPSHFAFETESQIMLCRSVIVSGLWMLLFASMAIAQTPTEDGPGFSPSPSVQQIRIAQVSPLQQPDGLEAAAKPAAIPILPPGDTAPLLRLETGGPRSYVSGLAFSPDGTTLYSSGWDKAVQVWNRNKDGKYEYSPGATLRVPTGSGLYGGLNGLVLSEDGQWLATAGQGHARDMSSERNLGWILPAGVLSEPSQYDEGLIYVFNTKTRSTRILKGHRGPVQSLAFVRGSRSNPPELVSIAEERVDGSSQIRPRIRLWDVGQINELANLNSIPDGDGKKWVALPSLLGFRPGLTAWSAGRSPKQTRVALAWGDDQFRVWDAESGQVAHSKTNPNILTVLPLPGRENQFLTGAHADIGIWSVPVTKDGELGALTGNNYQSAQLESIRTQNLPSAAVLIPTANGNAPHAMFVVTKYLSPERAEYRLLITTTAAPIKIVREIPLPWRGEVRLPALAVTRDGRSIAVAGTDSNSISLFSVGELLSGRDKPSQTLESSGVNFRDAAFVRAGERWGIMFNDSPTAAPGQFPDDAGVLDFQQRRIEPAQGRWHKAVANMPGWSANATTPGSLKVHRGDLAPLTLQLDDLQAVSSYAFCPASKHSPIPLIAVGTHLRGQPLLRLYRGDTGEPIRWCVGHTERVRNLAFSDDGRMLLSVGADRTIAVWTMADLVGRTLNKHGRIAGLKVHTKEGRLVVAEAPADIALQQGDEAVSIDRKGEAIALQSTKDLYQAILDRLPGETISLNIRRNGQMQAVDCPVGQAIDESKPLFTMFVVPGQRLNEWDWIGWHPLGNFDASGENVESLLGWQFNTGESTHPAKFATIGEYRDGFYKRDLLQSLIESQKLILPEVEEKPQISMWLRNRDGTPAPTDYEDRPQVESTQVQLVATVTGISDRRIKQLTVSFDDDAPRPLRQSSEREWTADLSESKWQRGSHELKLRLQTPDREVTKTERVQYRPAAPEIAWTPAWKGEIREDVVTVQATVAPRSEPVVVQLRIQRPGQQEAAIVRSWKAEGNLEISEVVPVDPGENQLVLTATNATAPEENRNLESTHIATFVRRATPNKTPRLTIDEVASIADSGPVVLVADGSSYSTTWPKVRVRGTITCEVPLDSADLAIGPEERKLVGFNAGKSRALSFDEVVTLKPGSQTIGIKAGVGDEKQSKRLTLSYEPTVPTVSSLSVTSAVQRTLPTQATSAPGIFYSGYHDPTATVTATIGGRLDHPYHVSVLVNDVRLADESVQIDRTQADQHRLRAHFSLVGGKNRIVVRVANDWNRQPNSQIQEVEMRRPPEILAVLGDDKLVVKSQQLSFRVRSQLPVRTARIVIDDSSERREFDVSPVKDSPNEWLLSADRFGLPEGEHTVRITATNDDGTSIEPVVHNIRMEKAAAPPPVLSIVGPGATELAGDRGMTVMTRQFQLRYTVNSTAATTLQLRMRGNSEKFEAYEKTVEPAAVAIDGTTGIEEVELFDGVNEIELTAHNIGGSSQKQILKVAYVVPATTVEIVSIGDQRPRVENNGTGYFDRAVSKSRLKLRGRVHVPNPMSNDQLAARIWVNSFKLPTIPVVMDEKDPSNGWFESEIVFSRLRGNEIRVEVFRAEGRIAAELGTTNTLIVDCTIPEREQEMYVLLLGEGDLGQMRDRARSALMEKALRARPLTRQQGSQEIWESDAFAHIHVHDALNASPAAVQNRLRELVGKMLRNLKSGGGKGSPQSIVMIYFQGRITLTKDDFAFGVLDTANPLTRAITGRILEENLMRSYGAHLIFLDLKQDSIDVRDRDIWPKAPHLGIVVHNWKGSGEQPEDSRLSAVLEKLFPQSRVVRDLAQKMDQQYLIARKQFPGKIETVENLKNVYDLRIGALDN